MKDFVSFNHDNLNIRKGMWCVPFRIVKFFNEKGDPIPTPEAGDCYELTDCKVTMTKCYNPSNHWPSSTWLEGKNVNLAHSVYKMMLFLGKKKEVY